MEWNEEQEGILKGISGGFRGPGLIDKAIEWFKDLFDRDPDEARERVRRNPPLKDLLANAAEKYRNDPSLGPEVSVMLDDVVSNSQSALDFAPESGMYKDPSVPYGESKERQLDYGISTEETDLKETPTDTEWVIDRSGSQNPKDAKIEKAQKYLIEIYGEDAVGDDGVDGYLGDNTQEALARFQKEYNAEDMGHDLRTDGNLDFTTLSALVTMGMFSPNFNEEPEEFSLWN